MSIVPSHIAVDLKFPIFKGPYSHIPVDLGSEIVPPVDCEELWKPRDFNDITFNLNVPRVEVDFNAVDFNFDCYTPPEDCPDRWEEQPSDKLTADFDVPWTAQVGNALVEDWMCSGEKPPIVFDGFIRFSDGESVEVRFLPDITVSMFDGEELRVTLQDHPAAIIAPSYYDGETVTLGLDLPLRATAYDGEYLSVNLQDHPAAIIAPRYYDGETTALTLYVPDRYVAYDGEYLTAALDIPPQPAMELRYYEGETSSASLSVAFSLGTVRPYDGESIGAIDLGFTGIYAAFDGEIAEADLSTQPTFSAELGDGESTAVSLMSFPSEPIGVLRFYDGEVGTTSMTTLRAVTLYPTVIAGDPVQFDVNATNRRNFELGTSCCLPCNAAGPELDIRLDYATDANVSSNQIGDCTTMSVELTTLKRFSFSFTDGEYFHGNDPNYLGGLSIADGEWSSAPTVSLQDYNFALCPGNLIPDGDYTFIELATTYDATCYADMLYDGETMSVDLAQEMRPTPREYDGERMDFDLYVNPIMTLLAYDGEVCRVSNPEFSPTYQDGEVMQFRFYEANYEGADGEEMTFDIQTRYFVEFLENGCLDNEYIPANENGDADMDRFRSVPIELDYFSHNIKARCF